MQNSDSQKNNKSILYDTIIVGGAAAGLTAAIYAARRTLHTLVLTKNIGGQAALTNDIENYPGINKTVEGFWLMSEFQKQAEKFGAEITIAEVTNIVPKEELLFEVHASEQLYKTKTIILTFGLTPKNAGIKGEQQFQGKGIAYCATCDAPLFQKKDVVVIGNNTAAMDAAILLTNSNAKSVTIITDKEKLSGNTKMIQAIEQYKNIAVETNTTLTEVQGNQFVETLIGTQNGQQKKWDIQGIFVELGHNINTELTKDLVSLDNTNHIIVDENYMTSHPGIFAAGDVTSRSCKQVVASAGQGCVAALRVYDYLQEKGEVKPKGVDWGTQE